MAEKLGPIESWNGLINSLLKAQDAWEIHFEVMDQRPNLELLPVEAQQRLRYGIHRSTDFDRFLLGFLNFWRVSGGLKEMMIPVEDKLNKLLDDSAVKGKKNARRK